MEQLQNKVCVPTGEAEMVRALLVQDNYEWIARRAQALGIEAVPIKGIDLLQTVYAQRFDRAVRDIDLLCYSEEDCRRLASDLIGEGSYRLEFEFSLRPEALAAKRKVSLLSNVKTKVNVDIHTALVTKKFFSRTVGTFNEDALQRIADGRLEAVDRWLFLAQHDAFHNFSDIKWVRDLKIIYQNFSEQQRAETSRRGEEYGFGRVVQAALWHCSGQRRETNGFLRFVRRFNCPWKHNLFYRFIAGFWEFAFIEKRSARLRAFRDLIFPNLGTLTNIYRVRHKALLPMYYLLNILIMLPAALLFGAVYIIMSR